jgi:hypothetical protein
MKKNIIVFIMFAFLSACTLSGSYELEEKLLSPAPPPIKSVVVLPFDIPLGGTLGLSKEGKIEEGATEKLSTFAEERLKTSASFTVISWEEVVNTLQIQDKGRWLVDVKRDIKEMVIGAGEMFKADAVLLGYVTRYEDRAGKKYGVEKPASISFSLFLFSAKDGSMIWTGSYRETQASLSENMLNLKLFVKRGFKWLTADELAKFGIEEILKNFPGTKK